MTERRYTLAEIDAMREWLYHRTIRDLEWWNDHEIKSEVEEHLRTAMIGGVDPAEFTNRTGNPADDETEN